MVVSTLAKRGEWSGDRTIDKNFKVPTLDEVCSLPNGICVEHIVLLVQLGPKSK